MSSESSDTTEIIARHEREIHDLQQQVRDLEAGYAKEKLKAEIAQRLADLEAEVKFQELQETMEKESEQQQRRRRFLGIL